MEVVHGIRFDTFAGTASRSSSGEDDKLVCSPCTRSALHFGTAANTMSQLRCIRRVGKRKLNTCGK